MRHRFLRWIFYTWTAIKRFVLALVVMGVLAVLGVLGLLQLDVTKRYIAYRAETALNERFRGTFSIGGLDGVLPFHARISELTVLHPDTVLHVRSLQASVSIQDLFSRRLQVTRVLLDHPDIQLDDRLSSAFQPRKAVRPADGADTPTAWTMQFPNITLIAGRVVRDSVVVDSIYLHAFAERSPANTYLDIAGASLKAERWSDQTIRFSGQYYQDSRFTEFNAIRVQFQKSSLRAGFVRDVALDSLPVWRFRLDSSLVHLPDLKRFWPDAPNTPEPLWVSVDGQGTVNGGEIRQLAVSYGGSRIDLSSTLLYPFDPKRLYYDAVVRGSTIRHADLVAVIPVAAFPDLAMTGRYSGDLTHLNARTALVSPAGKLTVNSRADWARELKTYLEIRFSDVNLASIRPEFPSSDFDGELRFESIGPQADASLFLATSRVQAVRVDTLSLRGYGALDLFRVELAADVSGSELTAGMTVDLTQSEPTIRLEGTGRSVDLHDFIPGTPMARTSLDMRYMADLTGSTAERVRGIISVDVDQAVVNGVKVKAHQLYLDLDSPDLDTRTMRFTSNVADATITGDIRVEQFGRMGTYWGQFLLGQVRRQFLLQDDVRLTDVVPDPTIKPVQLAIDASLKDLRLLNLYAPFLPPMGSRSDVNFLVSASHERLLVNGGIRGDSIAVGTLKALQSNLQISAQFRYGEDLNDFSQVRMQLNAGLFRVGGFEMADYLFETSLQNESLTMFQRANRIGQATRLQNRVSANLGDSLLAVTIEEFRLSTNDYVWVAPGKPRVELHPSGQLVLKDLSLANGQQEIDIRGAFSTSPDDSVTYRIDRFDLGRLSKLYGGRLAFDGMLSAVISTKSLTRDPAAEGIITISGFSLAGRTIGDVTFTSRLDRESDRFDTRLRIRTDSVATAAELRRFGGYGNDITLTGYVNTANAFRSTDTLYVLDADIRRADLWFVELINPDLFERIEGRALGRGWLAGGTDWIDFDSRIQIAEGRVTPTFLLTDYSVSGPIRLGRKVGLALDTLQIRDRFNGRGQIFGRLDFNDFKPNKELNLTMSLQNLQFLNNTFTADVPFYGTAFGTGTFVLSGRTNAPFLQTRGQVITSSSSRMSIPLLDETSVEEQARFVEFVSSFDEVWKPAEERPLDQQTAQAAGSSRFVEIFTLNLSFSAPPGSTVQLVFDPLTGEILNAQGSGSVQIRLEDQQFNVFGTFNVNQGDYTFVAGDIFVRKFDLRDGGTLVWEGPADNARLNVLASYRSRPDISVLNPALQATRIPVDLMLAIGGTIQSIENDFYFEFPNNNDITQNASALSILNSDEQKLIQATSLLFTGGFIPTTGIDATQQGNLQARGLSLLLSSQVNALLGSRISNLDVDFNLSGFNQADLGLALRLFNDRLVIRGQTQFDQTNQATNGAAQLGDLGATFRINRALSIEIFHRRDPTLRTLTGGNTDSETINGVGLEAQYQFHTWGELGQRMWASIRRFFGLRPSTATTTAAAN